MMTCQILPRNPRISNHIFEFITASHVAYRSIQYHIGRHLSKRCSLDIIYSSSFRNIFNLTSRFSVELRAQPTCSPLKPAMSFARSLRGSYCAPKISSQSENQKGTGDCPLSLAHRNVTSNLRIWSICSKETITPSFSIIIRKRDKDFPGYTVINGASSRTTSTSKQTKSWR